MKVVILCGGLGTRLREETEFRPKPMVNVGQRPILWHIMKHYAYYGFNDFILCLGYKGEMIREYFYNYEYMNNDVTVSLGENESIQIHKRNSEVDWRITLVDTGQKTLKGARLKKVEKYITNDDFFLTYGDGVSDIDIKSLLEFHHSHSKLATVTGINPASRFGELIINRNIVKAFNEKPMSGKNYINGGFFVFNKKILNYLSTDDNCDLEVGPLEEIAHAGQLVVYKHHGSWTCMDTLRDMDYLNKLWNRNKAFWKFD
ncbi:MAG: glucose-1-phosphate cytidylyltransferase [Calditrichia bacterium]|nr:glucose-1-phosphate cytidylyltransferase [Calditrichia bacterium]